MVSYVGFHMDLVEMERGEVHDFTRFVTISWHLVSPFSSLVAYVFTANEESHRVLRQYKIYKRGIGAVFSLHLGSNYRSTITIWLSDVTCDLSKRVCAVLASYKEELIVMRRQWNNFCENMHQERIINQTREFT